MDIRSELRELRLARGLTQADLAFLCSLSTTFVAQVERGERNVSLETALRLAEGLGVTVNYLCRKVRRKSLRIYIARNRYGD